MIYTNHFYPENFKINEVTNWLVESGYSVHVITGWPNYPRGVFFKGYGPFRNSFENAGLLVQKNVNAKIIKNIKGERIKFFEYFFIINSFYVMQEDLKY